MGGTDGYIVHPAGLFFRFKKIQESQSMRCAYDDLYPENNDEQNPVFFRK